MNLDVEPLHLEIFKTDFPYTEWFIFDYIKAQSGFLNFVRRGACTVDF